MYPFLYLAVFAVGSVGFEVRVVLTWIFSLSLLLLQAAFFLFLVQQACERLLQLLPLTQAELL